MLLSMSKDSMSGQCSQVHGDHDGLSIGGSPATRSFFQAKAEWNFRMSLEQRLPSRGPLTTMRERPQARSWLANYESHRRCCATYTTVDGL